MNIKAKEPQPQISPEKKEQNAIDRLGSKYEELVLTSRKFDAEYDKRTGKFSFIVAVLAFVAGGALGSVLAAVFGACASGS